MTGWIQNVGLVGGEWWGCWLRKGKGKKVGSSHMTTLRTLSIALIVLVGVLFLLICAYFMWYWKSKGMSMTIPTGVTAKIDTTEIKLTSTPMVAPKMGMTAQPGASMSVQASATPMALGTMAPPTAASAAALASATAQAITAPIAAVANAIGAPMASMMPSGTGLSIEGRTAGAHRPHLLPYRFF